MFSEKEIIEGCKRHDAAFFEALYKRYAGRLMAVGLRYVTTTFEAEDILQEAFIKIFRALPTYEYKGSFEGWLKKIVVHTAINQFHKHKKHGFPTVPVEAGDHVPEASHETVIDRMSADELIRVIQSLPEGYRIIFNLYEIEGYSHREIADMLGIQEGTSKSQLAKAKQTLRKLLVTVDHTAHESGR